MSQRAAPPAVLALVFALAACDQAPPADQMPVAPAEPIEAVPNPAPDPAAAPAPADQAAAPPVATGPAVTVRPSADDMLQWSASVTEVHGMPSQGAKLFSTAGGDPAVNGLYTYLALFQGAAEGWRVFQIGDFESWRVLEEAPGRVELEVRQSEIAQPSGEIVTATRRLTVAFDAAAPESITVTPAS